MNLQSIAYKKISLLDEIIEFCQDQGQITKGNPQALAIKLWSLAHGFTNLMLEDQFPKEYLQNQDLRNLLNDIIS